MALRLALIPQILGLVLLVVAFLVSMIFGGRGSASLVIAILAAASLALGLYVMWGRPWILLIGDTGYRVRFVRGAGVASSRWLDVTEVVTAVLGGTRCLVLRLGSGGQTIIPVDLLEGDADDLVRAMRDRLIEAHRRPGA
jgi:hypothetical protein